MNVVEAPKRFTWTALILELEIDGQPLKVKENEKNTIRPLISGAIKMKFPARVYETDSKSEPGILIIKRIK